MAPIHLISETCTELPKVSPARRREIVKRPDGRAEHARLVAGIEALGRIEARAPARPAPAPGGAARVAFWNAERCKYPDPSLDLLRRVGADIVLLCELDLGMARSGQRHTARELAEGLGQGYVFAAEYLELGLGDARERARHAGAGNRHGLHGAAILAPTPLASPALIRLETGGAWLDGANGERRVGGRIALAAMMPVSGVDVVFVSVHFESHSDPGYRAGQMGVLIDALEAYAPGAPVVIGGDFNTFSAARGAMRDCERKAALLAEDPNRLTNPVPHEPLFDVAAAAGFDWDACNLPGATQRTPRGGAPKRRLGRLDWFFTRGLAASDAAIVPAVDGAGTAISDHELLAVTVVPKAPGSAGT